MRALASTLKYPGVLCVVIIAYDWRFSELTKPVWMVAAVGCCCCRKCDINSLHCEQSWTGAVSHKFIRARHGKRASIEHVRSIRRIISLSLNSKAHIKLNKLYWSVSIRTQAYAWTSFVCVLWNSQKLRHCLRHPLYCSKWSRLSRTLYQTKLNKY